MLITITFPSVVTWRMLKESAVFFVLLALFGVGFGQALMGLDVADEKRDSTESESICETPLVSPASELSPDSVLQPSFTLSSKLFSVRIYPLSQSLVLSSADHRVHS